MELAVHGPEIVDGDPRIDLRGFQRGVAEHFLQLPDRRAVPEHVGGAAAAESKWSWQLLVHRSLARRFQSRHLSA
jgi:hypothetical protein